MAIFTQFYGSQHSQWRRNEINIAGQGKLEAQGFSQGGVLGEER